MQRRAASTFPLTSTSIRCSTLAGAALTRAEEYVELLRRAGTAPGLITFNAFIAGLARSNLRILAERGLGAKLSRSEVASVAAEVAADLVPRPSSGLGLSDAG